MYLTQTLNRHKIYNQHENIYNQTNNSDCELMNRRFLNNSSAIKNYSAYMSKIMLNDKTLVANRERSAPNIQRRVFHPLVSLLPQQSGYNIRPVVLQEIKPLSAFLERSDEMLFVSKLEVQLCRNPMNSYVQPRVKKALQEIRYLPAERNIDSTHLYKRCSSPDSHIMACLHLTDESEYPSNSSYLSTEFSSVKSINRNNNIINKKLYSAFSYVNPQQAINLKNFEDSNSDKISNFKSSFTFALSNSTSNSTSTSSFTSSGMSNLNKYAVPELSELTDETILSANGLQKEAALVRYQSNLNSKMSRQLLPSANRHGSSRNQNELTLPPIVETQISNNPNVNNNSKKSHSSTRVDSGIAVEYPNDNHHIGGGWTLSPNGSENGADNNYHNNNRHNEHVTTTIELVEGNLKKNHTSSTLNSLDKSSSIQSKLTTTTNISTNSSKFSQNFNVNNNNQSSNVSNIATKVIPISILQSEFNYIQNAERLGNIDLVPDHIIQNNNTSTQKQQLSVDTNKNTNNLNKNYQRNTTNHLNSKELNTSTSNLENLKRSSSNSTSNKPLMSLTSSRVKDIQDKQNNVNLLRVPGLQRQNTMTTIVHDSSNGMNRRNSNSTIANNTTASYQSARVLSKPKNAEITRRSLSLQRNNTSIPLTASSNSNIYNKSFNQFKSTQNTSVITDHFKSSPNPTLNRLKSTQVATINSLKRDPSLQMHRQSTNISIKAKENTNSLNNSRPRTTIYGQQQQQRNNLKSINSTSNLNGKPVSQKIDLTNPKSNKNAPKDSQTSNVEISIITEKQIPEPIAAFELPVTSEENIVDYTLQRIRQWLEDMEDCNMLQPPSALTWRDVNNQGNSGRAPNEFSRGFGNEYLLSDYDSNDEQIVEYNRVVDKTFHIIHDENDDFVPENATNNEN